jgi:hypothetical protein
LIGIVDVSNAKTEPRPECAVCVTAKKIDLECTIAIDHPERLANAQSFPSFRTLTLSHESIEALFTTVVELTLLPNIAGRDDCGTCCCYH